MTALFGYDQGVAIVSQGTVAVNVQVGFFTSALERMLMWAFVSEAAVMLTAVQSYPSARCAYSSVTKSPGKADSPNVFRSVCSAGLFPHDARIPNAIKNASLFIIFS